MILLDTVALIRLVAAQRFNSVARDHALRAEIQRELFVSAITAWELCMLESRSRSGELLDHDGALFFRSVTAGGSLQVIAIDEDIVIESRRLPGDFHQDPADRFIVATARRRGLTVVTSDRAILDFAALGHVQAIAC